MQPYAEQTLSAVGDVSGIQGEFCSKTVKRRQSMAGELPLDPRKKGVYSPYTQLGGGEGSYINWL